MPPKHRKVTQVATTSGPSPVPMPTPPPSLPSPSSLDASDQFDDADDDDGVPSETDTQRDERLGDHLATSSFASMAAMPPKSADPLEDIMLAAAETAYVPLTPSVTSSFLLGLDIRDSFNTVQHDPEVLATYNLAGGSATKDPDSQILVTEDMLYATQRITLPFSKKKLSVQDCRSFAYYRPTVPCIPGIVSRFFPGAELFHTGTDMTLRIFATLQTAIDEYPKIRKIPPSVVLITFKPVDFEKSSHGRGNSLTNLTNACKRIHTFNSEHGDSFASAVRPRIILVYYARFSTAAEAVARHATATLKIDSAEASPLVLMPIPILSFWIGPSAAHAPFITVRPRSMPR
jgi:hypothetical protein